MNPNPVEGAEKMELHDLIAMMAASLLGSRVKSISDNGGRTHRLIVPDTHEIEAAVETAQRIWQATIEAKVT